MRRFPDVQLLLLDGIVGAGLAAHAAIETPPDLTGVLPFVRVRRIGGFSDRFNDRATVDVDVLGPTYIVAERVAEQIRQWLVGPPPPLPQVDRVDCEAAPRELPWGADDGGVRRWGATYRLVSRRVLAT